MSVCLKLDSFFFKKIVIEMIYEKKMLSTEKIYEMHSSSRKDENAPLLINS